MDVKLIMTNQLGFLTSLTTSLIQPCSSHVKKTVSALDHVSLRPRSKLHGPGIYMFNFIQRELVTNFSNTTGRHLGL